MLSKEANIKVSEIPKGWSTDAADFVNRVSKTNQHINNFNINNMIFIYFQLLKRSASDRLGRNSIREIKDHAWLKDINWVALSKKEYPSPYIPKVITLMSFT